MSATLKYGDTVTIQNKTNNWQGGFLSIYTSNNQASDKFVDVVTSQSAYRGGSEQAEKTATGIWRIESGTNKVTGSEVMDKDIIYLKNLTNCDGGYLSSAGDVVLDHTNAPGEIYGVKTRPADSVTDAGRGWIVTLVVSSQDGKIKEGDEVSFTNRYTHANDHRAGRNNAGFLDAFDKSDTDGALFSVFTSGTDSRKATSGTWKMAVVNDPCSTPMPTTGNTTPQPIPDLSVNTKFTVTLINNEQWLRTAVLNINGKDVSMAVQGNQAISKQFTSSTTGPTTITMYDSKQNDVGGVMIMPTLVSTSLDLAGKAGRTVAFGAEKQGVKDHMEDEKYPGLDVIVHIDWMTNINQ